MSLCTKLVWQYPGSIGWMAVNLDISEFAFVVGLFLSFAPANKRPPPLGILLFPPSFPSFPPSPCFPGGPFTLGCGCSLGQMVSRSAGSCPAPVLAHVQVAPAALFHPRPPRLFNVPPSTIRTLSIFFSSTHTQTARLDFLFPRATSNPPEQFCQDIFRPPPRRFHTNYSSSLALSLSRTISKTSLHTRPILFPTVPQNVLKERSRRQWHALECSSPFKPPERVFHSSRRHRSGGHYCRHLSLSRKRCTRSPWKLRSTAVLSRLERAPQQACLSHHPADDHRSQQDKKTGRVIQGYFVTAYRNLTSVRFCARLGRYLESC